MTARTAVVALGDLDVIVEYSVCGRNAPATDIDPPECVEVELLKLHAGDTDISGLLEFPPAYEQLLERMQEIEQDDWTADDPDAAYDRWRDEQMETRE